MDQGRSELRQQIINARERVARDVESVAWNANVVDRSKERIGREVNGAKSTIAQAARRAAEVLRSGFERIPPSRRPMLFGGIALGLLFGLIPPVRRSRARRDDQKVDDVPAMVRPEYGTAIIETVEIDRETTAG